MRIALLAGGHGWHVRDLVRAATLLGHQAEVVDFRRVRAHVADGPDPLASFDAVVVRTMPPGRFGPLGLRTRAVLEAEAGSFATWGLAVGSHVAVLAPDGQPTHSGRS